ncbi:MAG: hypothetical protein QXI11_09000 [Thermoproteota archaeon]
MSLNHNSSISTTTTVCWGRVRGLSVEILKILKEGGLTSNMIGNILNVEGVMVRQYLYRLRRYGLLVVKDYFWHINEDMLNIINKIIENNKYNIYRESNRRVTEEKQKSNRRVTEIGNFAYINVEEKASFLCGKYGLSDSERAVVVVLLDWYRRYGSKYIVVNDVNSWSKYGLDNPPSKDTITNLLCKNIIYIYRDKIGVKIGLKSHIYNMLEAGGNAVQARHMA